MVRLKYKIAAAKIRKQFGSGDVKRDAGQTTPDDIIRFDSISYGDDKKFPRWQLLDVYRPKSAGGAEGDGTLEKLPVIVVVHGGAWVYGDKDVYQFYGMRLAQRGFAVVNYSYRLAPEVKFPAALEDAEKVFQWVCDNAEKYGLDTQNVFAVGDSAGGHLLSLYAAAVTNEEYAKTYPFIHKKNLVLRGVGLNCGKYSMDEALAGDKQMKLLLGGMMQEGGTPKEVKILDSYAHVTKDFPPSFVMTCKGDFLLGQAPIIVKALEAAGVKHEYNIYGTDEMPLWHVFHCDPKLQEAVICNDDECNFFKSLIQQ